MAGVFVTAFYSFRMLFLAFHGKERFAADPHHRDTAHGGEHHGLPPGEKPKESPWVVTVPLVLLAIPSVYAGWAYVEPMLVGGFFGDAIAVAQPHPAMAHLRDEWHGVAAFLLHGLTSLPLLFAFGGIAAAAYCYLVNPAVPERIRQAAGAVYTLLDNKYYFDRFNDWFFAGGARRVGAFLSEVGDRSIIDGFFVNGAARTVALGAALLRHLQSGYVYHYAFTMIVGLFALLSWWTLR
jgi:NADH-quinone oxidoreductase subunit L